RVLFRSVFHELATNASKYGALSEDEGRLEIAWAPDGEGILSLTWRERTRRTVEKPQREGFGSRLITMNVARELGGGISRDYRPDGFAAELRLPWNRSTGELVAAEEASTEGGQAVPSAAHA